MGCAQSQRGVYYDGNTIQPSVYVWDAGKSEFEAKKMYQLAVDDPVYTCYRDDTADPPFRPSGMGEGDDVNSLDGGPEEFGGGGDTWYQIEILNGTEHIDVPANQLLPTNYSVGGLQDVLAKDLTTNHYAFSVNFGHVGLPFTQTQITDITSSTNSGLLYHPLFDTPTNSRYYAAARGNASGYGILVATCLGEF
jgi:hypothetical protein